MNILIGLAFGLILVGVVGLVITEIISTRNKLIPLQNGVHEAHANVIGSLQKRINVTYSILSVAKQYEKHESQMHGRASDATIHIATLLAQAPQQGQGFNVILSSLATTYPSLRANEAYQQLMSDLVTVENELHNRIELRNSKAKAFNDAQELFPANILRNLSGSFLKAEFLDASMAPTLLPFRFDEKSDIKEQDRCVPTSCNAGLGQRHSTNAKRKALRR